MQEIASLPREPLPTIEFSLLSENVGEPVKVCIICPCKYLKCNNRYIHPILAKEQGLPGSNFLMKK